MDKFIHLVGLSHHTAPVEIRENFALTEFCSPQTWAVPQGNSISESLILSTCNRVEILAVGGEDAPRQQILTCWSKARNRNSAELEPYIYHYRDAAAVRHIFSVASSLDSLVVGEPQILGQLKDAYRYSVEARHAGLILNRLLHKSFSVAKRVRTETGVASSAVSISYAAVELAKRIFGDMAGHDALLIGAGEMAELAAMHLLQAGIRRIRIANRTAARARELAEKIGGEAVLWEKLLDCLADADIVISSTGASGAILRAGEMREVMRRRKQRPMFLIDIALPRDIAPDVNSLDNVYLYDIDDLKEVVEENLAQRRKEALKARAIVEEETETFGSWMRSLALQPTIVDLVRRGEDIVRDELDRTFRRLGPLDDATRKALETMAASLVRRFNHEPITFLKKNLHEAEDHDHALENIAVIRHVFQLDQHRPRSETDCPSGRGHLDAKTDRATIPPE